MHRLGEKSMKPLIFIPDFQERVWGGQKLKTVFGKEIPTPFTGESWEVACHDNGQSVVANGPLAGLTLEEALIQEGEAIIGQVFNKGDKFPLLIKFIDAADRLSVQVHPEDAYAMINEHGELGKSECWYILEADEGATLIAGLKEGVNRAAFVKALEEQKLESVLNEVAVKAGDVIDIPAGLIHAIKEGILLAEVQQNSDTTYRVYDWNRVGLDGEMRPLHVEKSLEVSDFEGKHNPEPVLGVSIEGEGYRKSFYIGNTYFALEKIELDGTYEDADESFSIFICLKGTGIFHVEGEALPLSMGQSLLMPASVTSYTIEGQGDFLKTYVPISKEALVANLEAKGYDKELLKTQARI